MSCPTFNKWLCSRKYAKIGNKHLKPIENKHLRGEVLCCQRGQAEVSPLIADDKSSWMLKIFLQNKCPDTRYLNSIKSILPDNDDAFMCATKREVLTSSSPVRTPSTFYSAEFAKELNNTILMPQVPGTDWTEIIDQIRDGSISLSRTERITLSKNLANVVKKMEVLKFSHRDFSTGNVFPDLKCYKVRLIDFDSAYHPKLRMPKATTIGSEGYIAPFIDVDNSQDTFHHHADRFALTILIIEFLILNKKSPYAYEGGIFEQDDIYKRQGKTITYAVNRLRNEYPEALNLFKRAIKSNSFQDCPSPDDWISFCNKSGDFLSVDDMPAFTLELPKVAKIEIPPEVSLELPKNKPVKIRRKKQSVFTLPKEEPVFKLPKILPTYTPPEEEPIVIENLFTPKVNYTLPEVDPSYFEPSVNLQNTVPINDFSLPKKNGTNGVLSSADFMRPDESPLMQRYINRHLEILNSIERPKKMFSSKKNTSQFSLDYLKNLTKTPRPHNLLDGRKERHGLDK